MGLGFTPLYAAGLVADRQHRAGRVRRDRHADPDAGCRHRHFRRSAGRDGGPSAAVRVAASCRRGWWSTMSGWQRPARRVAGGARLRRDVRDRAVCCGAITSAPSWSTSRAALLDRLPGAFCTMWKPTETWDFPADVAETDRGQPTSQKPIGGLTPDARPAPAPVRGQTHCPVPDNGSDPTPGRARAGVDAVGLPLDLRHGVGHRAVKAFLNAGAAGTATYRASGVQPAPHAILSPAFDVPALHRMVFRDFPSRPPPSIARASRIATTG